MSQMPKYNIQKVLFSTVLCYMGLTLWSSSNMKMSMLYWPYPLIVLSLHLTIKLLSAPISSLHSSSVGHVLLPYSLCRLFRVAINNLVHWWRNNNATITSCGHFTWLFLNFLRKKNPKYLKCSLTRAKDESHKRVDLLLSLSFSLSLCLCLSLSLSVHH